MKYYRQMNLTIQSVGNGMFMLYASNRFGILTALPLLELEALQLSKDLDIVISYPEVKQVVTEPVE